AAPGAGPDTGRAGAFVTPEPPGRRSGAPAAPSAEASAQEATTADVGFVAAMVVHHDQAVALARLASGRAADPELAELASRIVLVQGAEADAMRNWLDRRRSPAGVAGEAHDHGEPMSGDISSATLDRAAGLHGAAFDRLFVQAMLPHHRGAVQMAEERLAQAGDPAVARWARTIANAQALEIDRLVEMEARLPLD
ncbi:DUF305 domain-containing protein, partial [Agromyces humi]|uniref:DUF305 domain-containing protein n=1 Tax=Agromyces humi TaxID=1766800 RepID=UPI0019394AB1